MYVPEGFKRGDTVHFLPESLLYLGALYRKPVNTIEIPYTALSDATVAIEDENLVEQFIKWWNNCHFSKVYSEDYCAKGQKVLTLTNGSFTKNELVKVVNSLNTFTAGWMGCIRAMQESALK